ncbi:MAG: hypothetical protein R3C49_22430 [Planctomycetaceae bacterium]
MLTTVPNQANRRVIGRIPRMSETKYDVTVSAELAVLLILGLVALLLVAVWAIQETSMSTLSPPPNPLGKTVVEESAETEPPSAGVSSVLDTSDDTAVSNVQSAAILSLSSELLLADVAQHAAFVELSGVEEQEGQPNGAVQGTGKRPLGIVPSREDRREQRWQVQFSDPDDIRKYARQLDFFGIELACAFPDGRIYYVRSLSDSPQVRLESTDNHDDRLFLVWEGGDRVQADIRLLTQAGVPWREDGRILHFYEAETEQMLADLELASGNQPPERIRKTVFQVRSAGTGFEFVVTGQMLR